MRNPPRNRDEAESYPYGRWQHAPSGYGFHSERCAWEHKVTKWWPIPSQCKSKPGHGPDKLYCKKHAMILTLLDSTYKRP